MSALAKTSNEATLLLRELGTDFTSFYRSHHGAVRAVLFRFGVLELEDAVQDVFVKAFRGQSAFRGDAQSKTWLISIAINHAKDIHRRSPLRTSDVDVDQIAGESGSRELSQTIDLCLKRLPDIHREVLILCAMEGYAMREAAEILNVPEGTVKSRLSHARDAMRAELLIEGVEA